MIFLLPLNSGLWLVKLDHLLEEHKPLPGHFGTEDRMAHIVLPQALSGRVVQLQQPP